MQRSKTLLSYLIISNGIHALVILIWERALKGVTLSHQFHASWIWILNLDRNINILYVLSYNRDVTNLYIFSTRICGK